LSKNKKISTHAYLVERLRELIKTKKTGERLENDRVLSEVFGVSRVTLRAAMLDLVKDGYVERKVGSGSYVLDKAARKFVAIALPDYVFTSNRDPFPNHAFLSLLDVLNHEGLPYKLFVFRWELHWPKQSHVENSGLAAALEKDEVLALININIGISGNWAQSILDRNIPVIGLTTDENTAYRVQARTVDSVRYAVRYLTNFGCSRIGLLSWSHPGRVNDTLNAFQDELSRMELAYYPEWVRSDVDPAHEALAWRAFRDIWGARTDEKPDALIVTDDRLFSGVTSTVLEAGIRVPRDLQIVTHWNKNSGFVCPFPVARYEIDPDLAGRMLYELVKSVLADPSMPPTVKYIEPEWFTEGQYDSVNDSYMKSISTRGTSSSKTPASGK
jgi:DNA-binding LacI/PurR family transcriptional regulator